MQERNFILTDMMKTGDHYDLEQFINMHSYDLEQDPVKRIDKIVSLCKDLKNKNWQEIYLQTKSLRQQNYDTFFNKEKLSLEINKTLKLFLKFAD